MWPEVVAYVERNYVDDNPSNMIGQTVSKLVADMKERDQVGRERYGVPLTSKNGRDALVDAYQEQLDFVVYMRTWLDDRGIDPIAPDTAEPTNERETIGGAFADGKPKPLDDRERVALYMFYTSVEMCLQLRGMIE